MLYSFCCAIIISCRTFLDTSLQFIFFEVLLFFMDPLSNVHTHTTYSDGENTMAEYIDCAIGKGFLSLGFSDHSPTGFDLSYCMASGAVERYFADFYALREKYADRIELLIGIELDYYTDPLDLSRFDYTIGSVHYVVSGGTYYPVDDSQKACLDAIRNGFGGDGIAFAKTYYRNICGYLEHGSFDVLGHFDLPTKFDLFDETDAGYRRAALEAAECAASRGVLIEVNTGSIARGVKNGHPYPSDFLLQYFYEKHCPIILGADAHKAAALDTGFCDAKSLLKAVGFRSAVRLRAGGVKEEYPL